jgi:hypothetical protein
MSFLSSWRRPLARGWCAVWRAATWNSGAWWYPPVAWVDTGRTCASRPWMFRWPFHPVLGPDLWPAWGRWALAARGVAAARWQATRAWHDSELRAALHASRAARRQAATYTGWLVRLSDSVDFLLAGGPAALLMALFGAVLAADGLRAFHGSLTAALQAPVSNPHMWLVFNGLLVVAGVLFSFQGPRALSWIMYWTTLGPPWLPPAARLARLARTSTKG